jgi:hypothetical protein
MKRAPLSILYLLSSILAVSAQPSGVVTKTATHATLSAVTFPPPARPAPVIAADVISDKAAARLTIQYGDGARHTALSNAAANATTLYLTGTSLASNAVVLHVSGATVTSMTIKSNALPATNAVLAIQNPLGVAVTAGTTAREVTSTYSTVVLPHAAASNLLWLDTTNGWAADMVALIEGPPGTYQTGVVATATRIASYPQILPSPLPFDVINGTTVREFGTANTYTLAAVAADATAVHVATTNGFINGGSLVVVRTNGAMLYGTIAGAGGSVNTTNITLAAALGEVINAGDFIYPMTAQAYTVAFPGWAGDRSISLNVPTGLVNGDRLAVVGAHVWDVRITQTNAISLKPQMTFTEVLPVAVNTGARVWQLTTNIYTTSRVGAATDFALNLETADGLAAGDFLMFNSDTNYYVRQISTTPALEYFLRADLAAATGVTVAAGDILYAVNSTYSSLVGAATVRLVPTAWTIPQACPARVSLDSTSTGTINSVSVNYGQ